MKSEKEIRELLQKKLDERLKLKLNKRKKGNKRYRIPYLSMDIELLLWVLEGGVK